MQSNSIQTLLNEINSKNWPNFRVDIQEWKAFRTTTWCYQKRIIPQHVRVKHQEH